MKHFIFQWEVWAQVLEVEKLGGDIVRIGTLYVEYYARHQLHSNGE